MITASQAYQGFANPSLPYSLVVRHGTSGTVRERTEQMLRERLSGPFQTKGMADDAKHRLDPGLRPFVEVIKYTGEEEPRWESSRT